MGLVGTIFGLSWALLGPSWGHLGAILGHLGRSSAILTAKSDMAKNLQKPTENQGFGGPAPQEKPQGGFKMAPERPKMAQDRPMLAPDGPKMAQSCPKMAQDGPRWPKMAPRWPQDGPRSEDDVFFFNCFGYFQGLPGLRARAPEVVFNWFLGAYTSRGLTITNRLGTQI